MANKVSFTNLKLKINIPVKEIEINSTSVEVSQYLPIEDKYDMINIALQNSEENGYYNPIKLEMYLDLYMVYMYTNLNFTDKQKEDETKLYDILVSNGIIEAVKNAMPDGELYEIQCYTNELKDTIMKYKSTLASVMNGFIDQLPKNAEEAMNIVSKFDPEKFQTVLQFAQMANGNRAIQ